MEIVNLIISILSLLATVAISFVIYFLEKRNSKLRIEHDIREQAKRFIIENAEERGYLPWAVVASGCFPQNHHLRKIYNEFTLLDDEVKAEVLRQADLNVPLIKGFDWVDEKIEALEESSRKLGLGDAFLYDGAKYFHRLYDDKERDTAIVYSDIGARIIRMFLGLTGLAYTKEKDLFLLLDTWTIIYIVNLKNQRNSPMNG